MSDGAGTGPVPAPILALKGAAKHFDDTGARIELFSGLDLAIAAGDFLSITGASGVGKSTLLHILGLLDRPSAGAVEFLGEDTRAFTDRRLSAIRNRELGFVFQFHHLLPDFTVWENMLMPIRIAGRPGREDRRRAEELIGLVGLLDRRQHLPSELSGGERQRIALARALIRRPRLLLCDEPSGNLDRRNAEALHAHLSELNRAFGVALVVVTHDPGLAAQAGRRFVMEGGGLRSLGGEGT